MHEAMVAKSGAAISGQTSLKLRQKCREAMEIPGKPLSGLAVVVVRGGDLVWEEYFGVRRFAASEGSGDKHKKNDADLPVDAETRWRAASISKPVVALGAMSLEAEGLLDLDRDISDYMGYSLRNPYFPKKAITPRMLLGHHSSLRDAGFYYPPLGHSIRDLLVPGGRYYDGGAHFALPASDSAIDKSPGAFYCYCNLAMRSLAGSSKKWQESGSTSI